MKSAMQNTRPSKLPVKGVNLIPPKKPFFARSLKNRSAMEATLVPNNSKETVEVLKVEEKKEVATDQCKATGDGPQLRCLNCERMAKNFMFLEDMIKTRGMSGASKKTCHTCLSALNYLQWLNQIIRSVFQTNTKKTDDDKEEIESKKKLFPDPEPQKPIRKVKKKSPPPRQTKLIKAKIAENLKNGLRSHEGIDMPKFRPPKQNIIQNPKIRSPRAKY